MDEIKQLLAEHNNDFRSVADGIGLDVTWDNHHKRGFCFLCGEDKKRDNAHRSLAIITGRYGHLRFHCFRCQSKGDLGDLMQFSRGWSTTEFMAWLKSDVPPDKPSPNLRVVPKIPLASEPDGKLTPTQVKAVWEGLKGDDSESARNYLDDRGLLPTREGLVRYNSGAGKGGDKKQRDQLRYLAKTGYHVAMLASNVVGEPKGIQFRLAGTGNSQQPKMKCLIGSTTSKAFLGEPWRIEDSPVVAVTEGMADTLAVQLWTEGKIPVAGAIGMNNLPSLAHALADAGLQLDGKLFVLFVQNDPPPNKSRANFLLLKEHLQKMGATCLLYSLDLEFEDIAKWFQYHSDDVWPPDQVAHHISVFERGMKDVSPAISRDTKQIALPPVVPGASKKSLGSLYNMMADPSSRFAITQMTQELEWDERTGEILFAGQPVETHHLTNMLVRLCYFTHPWEGGEHKYTHEELIHVLSLIAHERIVNRLREYLESLKWDGTERIESELATRMSAEPYGLEATMLKKFMISAVARALTPGCKVDTVLILKGPQGIGKSTFFRLLGGEWFSDDPIALGDKDSKMLIRKSWIIEMAELVSLMRYSSKEELKSFITQSRDIFRPPYERKLIEAPRSCVFVGTTNQDDFLSDTTGSRRFWVVETKSIDLEWIREHRDALFAEAVAAFRAGELWRLTAEQESFREDQSKKHFEGDAWVDLVQDYLLKNRFGEVSISDILEKAILKPTGQWTRADETRIGKILHLLGYEAKRLWGGGTRRRVYVKSPAQVQD